MVYDEEIKDALDKGYFEIQEQKQYKQWKSEVAKNPNRRKPKKRVASLPLPFLLGNANSDLFFPLRYCFKCFSKACKYSPLNVTAI